MDSFPFCGFSAHSSGVPSFSAGGSSSQPPVGFTSWSPFWKDPARLSSIPFSTAKRSGFQMGGSRVVDYKPAYYYEEDNWCMRFRSKFSSISAMLAYNDMSHEELRWIDYWRGDKGGSNDSGDVIRIRSENTESGMVSINIEIPFRVATQLLDSLKSICMNASSVSTSHSTFSPNTSTPFSNTNAGSNFSFSDWF